MANWLLMSGGKKTTSFQNSGLTKYWSACGWAFWYTNEVRSEYLARDSYTLKNLFIRISDNTINTGTSTFKTRKNGANGSQSVSIGAGSTGIFEDTSNTDSLSDGDTFCLQCITSGSSGWISPTVISLILVGDTTILGGGYSGLYAQAGWTRYGCIKGIGSRSSTEADTPYTFRTTATLSNLRSYISTNTINTGTSTVRVRIDGVNGNQVLSIGAGVTGAFEDISNTDSISVGGKVNYQIIGSGATGYLQTQSTHMKSDSQAMQIAVGSASGTSATKYIGLEGTPGISSVTESEMQVKARISFRAANGFCLVIANATSNTSIRLRKNGANGNLVISITGSTTGVFEDLVNSDDIIATDLVNWLVVSTIGSIVFTLYGFEQGGAVVTYPSDSATRVTELVHRYTSANVPSNKILTLEVLLGGATFQSITVLSQRPPTDPELIPVPPSAIPIPPPPDALLQDPFAEPVFGPAFMGLDLEGNEQWMWPDGTIEIRDPDAPPRAGGRGPARAI